MRVRTAALPGSGVPDSEALRRAALQASWLRDRRVGRRRVIWRWILWFLLRGVLPIGALASVLLLAWLLMQQPRSGPASAPSQALPASSPMSAASAGSEPPALPAAVLRLDLGTSFQDSPGRASSDNLQPSTSGDTRP